MYLALCNRCSNTRKRHEHAPVETAAFTSSSNVKRSIISCILMIYETLCSLCCTRGGVHMDMGLGFKNPARLYKESFYTGYDVVRCTRVDDIRLLRAKKKKATIKVSCVIGVAITEWGIHRSDGKSGASRRYSVPVLVSQRKMGGCGLNKCHLLS